VSRFNECLHGSLEEIPDTGGLTDAELRALVQNMVTRVIRLKEELNALRRQVPDDR
jgi:hypothetical protein